ncbi:MAG TPA: hydrogenase maturation protease [Gallionella sp.]|nr:hydrogenase maturation protease [Gallionella sp.]
MAAPVLIFAIGNESRGDDAIAPMLLRSLAEAGMGSQIELIEDYQLQIEHVTDLAGRERVLFIDADMSCAEPFHLAGIAAEKDNSYTSHAMTPHALLHAYRQVYGDAGPEAFLLRMRGYAFELGDPLSDRAASNLDAAGAYIRGWLADIPTGG